MPRIGRPPRIRKNYIADAKGILHLAQAVELDNKKSEEWKKKVIDKLNDVAMDLIKGE